MYFVYRISFINQRKDMLMQYKVLDLDETELNCSKCNWVGFGNTAKDTEPLTDYGYEMACPSCGDWLGTAVHPTAEEMLASPKVSESEKCGVRYMLLRAEAFEKVKLKDISQLKDINDDNIILYWTLADKDRENDVVRIMYNDEIIWEETSFYECCFRFDEVAKILKLKYGSNLKDLIPTKKSEFNLYGDNFISIPVVRDAIKHVQGK